MKVTHAVRRQAPFVLYLAVVVAMAGSIAYFGWVRTWTSVFVPAMYPPFADMRLIQGAVISVEHGLNPQISNLGDPWGRLFDYPMLWVTIGKALNFTDESRFILICTALVLSFVGVCALLLFRFPSFGLLASLVSTTTLWGIERGNTDLVMFCLLFPVALWIPKLWSPVPILLGTALKLYPVFALGALLIQREFRLFAASLVAAVAILVYLWDQLAAIWSSIPVVCWMGYGFASLRFCLRAVPFWQVAGTFAIIGIATLALTFCFCRSSAVRPQLGTAFNLLLVGASIYVGTFLVSSNYDYRLIFLVFCIPFLQRRPFPFARTLIVLIVLAMNEWLWGRGPKLFIFALGPPKIILFVVFCAYLIALGWTAVLSLYAMPKTS